MKKNLIPDRFEVIRTLREDSRSKTLFVNDHLLELNGTVLRIIKKDHVQCDRTRLIKHFSWVTGVRHNQLATVFDAGLTRQSHLYYVREYLPSSELFSIEPVAAIKLLLSPVDFLSAKGRVHGAIKPSNIFVANGHLKLADGRLSGLGFCEDAESVHCTAPEVLQGANITFEADLYSVGAIFLRLLTGRYLFDDADLIRLKSKYVSASGRGAACLYAVSERIVECVLQLLSKNPAKRVVAFENLKRELGVRPTVGKRAIFVGREESLEQVAAIVQRPATALQVILIEGQAGIGKSRFIEEMHLHCTFQGLTFAIWQCVRNSTDLVPILAGLRRLLRSCPAVMHPQSKSRLNGFNQNAFDDLIEPEASENSLAYPIEKIVSDLVTILVCFAQRMPLVLAIEDVEQADKGTMLLLEQLSFRADEVPLTVLLTSQIQEVDSDLLRTMAACLGRNFFRFGLKALSEEESTRMVQFLEHNRDVQFKLLQRSGGNPLFIECYARSHVASPAVAPETVKKTATSMLSILRKETRSFGQLLSVFCKPIDVKILPILCGEDVSSVESKLSLISRLGIVRRTRETVEISYPIVRAKLYASIPKQAKTNLNRAAFLALRGSDSEDESLAHYAFEAGMFTEAAAFRLALARSAYHSQNYRAALAEYEWAQSCYDRSGTRLQPSDLLDLAKCYECAGKQRLARQLYEELLSSEPVQQDSEFLSLVYARLGKTFGATPARDRIELLERAVQCLPENSPQLIHRNAQLCTALIRIGEFSRAHEVFGRATQYIAKEPKDISVLHAMRATMLMNAGDFRGAKEAFLACTDGTERTGVTNNVAFCSEHLGDLTAATEYQLETQKAALTNGHMPIHILSIGNLAAIKTKLGDLREAANLFDQARDAAKRFVARADFFDKPRFLFSVNADAALHAIYTGDYQHARECIKKPTVSTRSLFEMDEMLCEVVRCKFFFDVGLIKKFRELLRRLDRMTLFKIDFFRVERTLLEAKLADIPAKERAEHLEHALVLSKNLGTLYQQCELLNGLAGVFLELAERERAEDYSKRALQLANDKGYRLLAARALLLTGQASKKQRDKQHRLSDALHLASEIGLPELVAEAAYHIGMLNLDCGNIVTAREYLIRSTSISAGLAEGVPLAGRSKYAAIKWRRDGRRALARCNDSIPLNSFTTTMADTDKYFPAAYRLTMSVTAAHSVERVVDAIQETLTRSLSRAAVITLKHQDGSYNVAIRTKLSPELTDRIQVIRTRNKDRLYFDAADENGARQATAWIPLISETCEGGIYVVSRAYEQPFGEKEIELLTMIGVITSAALKKIETRNEAVETTDLSEFHGILGGSKAIKDVFSQIDIAAGNAANVLIEGESGTGKELVAKAIHAAGLRAKQPLIPVDCGSIPEALIEAELFGAKKGSYTGAVADRPGLFEAAHQGTIFLDEISNTTPALQAKLLRVIQEREVRRIGETRGRPIDVRLIVASNQNLDALAAAGHFRKDLLYRLKVLHIKVPPLRNRRDDIPMIAHGFLQKLNTSNKTKKYFAPGILTQLSIQTFPGNVRELQNAIERAFFSARRSLISIVPLEGHIEAGAPTDDVQTWFQDLSDGLKDSWPAVRSRYKQRHISREKILALVDFGLRSARGNYRTLASMFHLDERDYRRFIDFLRRNDCLLDFRPYRKAAAASHED